jgi:hypothetical protein
MSERERWIVYPLLFLALGAALRDKLINSTESQRVKCQGLMVYDSTGDVSMVLGADVFPEVRQQLGRNHLKLDAIEVARLRVTDSVSFQRIEHMPRQGVRVSITGANVIRLLAWLDQYQQYFTRVQQTAQKLREQQQRAAAQGEAPAAESSPMPPVGSPPIGPPPPEGPPAEPGDGTPEGAPAEQGQVEPPAATDDSTDEESPSLAE